MISPEEIEKLAALSRIEMSEDEKKKLGTDIESVLGYVSEIHHVVSKKEVVTEKSALRNVMREDGDPHETGAYTETLLKEVPVRENNYVRVKKILQ